MRFTVRRGYDPKELTRLHHIECDGFNRWTRWNRETMGAVLETSDVWVARDRDGDPIGYLAGWVSRGTPEIGALSVLSDYRGRGIGRVLMNRAEKFYRVKGFMQAQLRVQTQNPAQVMYFMRGYRATGFIKRTFDKDRDVLVMRKDL